MNILLAGCDVFGLDVLLNSSDTYTVVDQFSELRRMPSKQREAILSRVKIATDAKALLKSEHFDMAIVGVPNYAKNTVDIECDIIQAHLPLFINKLRLRNPSDCYEMATMAKQYNVPTMVGEYYRCAGGVTIAKNIIESGILGHVEQVGYVCAIPSRAIAKWESAYKHLVLEDLTFHHLSVLDYLLQSYGGIETAAISYAASRSPRKAAPLTGTVVNVALMLGSTFIDYHVNWHGTIHNTEFFGIIDIDCEYGSLSVKGDKCDISWADGSFEQRSTPAKLPPVTTMADAIRRGQIDVSPSLIEFEHIIRKIYDIIALTA